MLAFLAEPLIDPPTLTEISVCNNYFAAKSLVEPCSKYKILSEPSRAASYYNKSDSSGNDKDLSGWYRFGGEAGNQMAVSCVTQYHCGATYPGWLSGSHPSVADGKVDRKVCFNIKKNNCQLCLLSIDITVRNCSGGFYVYKLVEPPLSESLSLRYCGNGLPPTPGRNTFYVNLFASNTIPLSVDTTHSPSENKRCSTDYFCRDLQNIVETSRL